MSFFMPEQINNAGDILIPLLKVMAVTFVIAFFGGKWAVKKYIAHCQKHRRRPGRLAQIVHLPKRPR